MDFEKVDAWLRAHWTAIVISTIIVAPTAVAVTVAVFGERLAYLQRQHEDAEKKLLESQARAAKLESEKKDLTQTIEQMAEERLKDRKQQVRPMTVSFDTLYTPSIQKR